MGSNDYYFIGIDGGATKTTGVLFNSTGKTLSTATDLGTNLVEYPKVFPKRILNVINNLCSDANITIDMIDSIGLGIAGTSNEYGRELLFKTMSNIGLDKRSLIISDAESAFVTSCKLYPAFLISIGTGLICMGRKNDGSTFRTAGKGHADDGDVGSGFWIGKKMIMHLALNESIINEDRFLYPMSKLVMERLDSNSFSEAVNKIANSENKISITASFARDICDLAEKGNDVALGILQEGTQAIADEILNLVHKMDYTSENILLSGNGSLARNIFFRRCLNDAMRFDFNDIAWTFSKISSAYGSGILSAKLVEVEISLESILKGDPIAAV